MTEGIDDGNLVGAVGFAEGLEESSADGLREGDEDGEMLGITEGPHDGDNDG